MKNNNSKFFKDWTTQKLKDEAQALDQAIYDFECYGTKDLIMYDGICAELKKRGIEPTLKLAFK